MSDSKSCSTCKLTKPTSEFDRDSRYKSGFRSQCSFCNTKGKHKSSLSYNLKRRYGITLEDYEKLSVSQNNVCAICSKKETRVTRPNSGKYSMDGPPRLVVDHNHETGVIRGLLCHKCNVGLGQFNDSIYLLERAVEYLRNGK